MTLIEDLKTVSIVSVLGMMMWFTYLAYRKEPLANPVENNPILTPYNLIDVYKRIYETNPKRFSDLEDVVDSLLREDDAVDSVEIVWNTSNKEELTIKGFKRPLEYTVERHRLDGGGKRSYVSSVQKLDYDPLTAAWGKPTMPEDGVVELRYAIPWGSPSIRLRNGGVGSQVNGWIVMVYRFTN